MHCVAGHTKSVSPGKTGRRSSGIPCPCYSAFDVGRHDVCRNNAKMAPPSNMKSLIAGEKHAPSAISRSPLMRPSTGRPYISEVWRSQRSVAAVRPSHGGRHIRSPGVVKGQVHSPPRFAHDREVVDISDRREKIPRRLLFNRNRWPKARAQAHYLL